MMAPWQHLLLLASLVPPTLAAAPTRRPGVEDRREEGGRRGRAEQTVKVLDFSLDVDSAPDSNGSYTAATLEMKDVPPPHTICAAFMVEAWNTPFTLANLYTLKNSAGAKWGYVQLYAALDYTAYEVQLGPTFIEGTIPTVHPDAVHKGLG